MQFLDKIEAVLLDAGEPMHANSITERLIASGQWVSKGKTPAESVHARIAADIKHNHDSRFIRTAPATFGLRVTSAGVEADSKSVVTPDPGFPTKGAVSPLSFLDAAEHVLERFGDRKPMHYRAISAKALEEGLVVTSGKTPEATFYAQIITEIERRERRGERPRFIRYGRGYVGLTRWNAQGLEFQIARHNETIRKQLHERIGSMPPEQFEGLIGTLLTKLGFEDVEVTSRSGDGGIDVRGTMVTGDVIRTRMAVQVKRWKANVQAPTVQQVRGSLGTHEQGLIITTSGFSSGARQEAQRRDATPVGLMDGEQLVKLLIENEVGVTRGSQLLLQLAENDE